MANYYYVKNSIKPIPIGFEGENDARTVVFDIHKWIEDYGNGSALLVHQRPGDAEPYPVTTAQKAGTVEWSVQQADIIAGAPGRAQLSYQVGDNIVTRSPIYRTIAADEITNTTLADYDPAESWLNAILGAVQQAGDITEDVQAAQTAATQAGQSATAAAGSATAASDSATAAAGSAETAQTAATTATDAAGQAQASQTAAAGSASEAANAVYNAVTAAQEAAVDALRARESASAALTSQNAAKTSEDNAKDSATQAAASASAAATSAEQAAQSAASIGNSVEQAQAAASTAATKASEAAQSAESAQKSADDIKELVPIPTMDDNGKILTVVDGKWAARDPGYPVGTWADIQKIVRLGAAPRYFPVGYEFTTHDSTEDNDIIWQVIGYDTIKAADESLTHTMILETKYAYSHKEGYARTIMYGFKDALYYAETGLTAGTYHFTLPNTYPSDGGGKTYSFTLTQPVPAGGLVDFEWFHGTQAIDSLIKTYVGPMDIVPIETASLTEGNNGTYLGTADGTSANMNIDSRVRYGSNNYAQGVMRKWLNTAQTDPFVWATPETKFNRFPKLPGLTLENRAGFLSGLPEDFLSVVQTAVVPNKTNTTFETPSLDGTVYELDTIYYTRDKFFLLHTGDIQEGYEWIKVLEYYKDATNVDRIKYSKNGTAVNYWLRSCHSTQPAWASSVLNTGAFSSAGTTNIMAVCPACIIA